MSESRFIMFGLDLRVVCAMLGAALVLGAVNNALVGDDKRVAWSGRGIAADESSDVERDPASDVQDERDADGSDGDEDDEEEEA